ncbi:hypothetical protein IU449_26835 [Nocardia higoensis]|uniref:Uncharacterized protein n=1 Tax=Nocardia higoensis TaxID=228599 RepID=A0ABS0DI27_9NOCA|nr:hypothetical protein [Nocardia higoensis]MBF6358116.1 hypothetical protein [Nocardia higoensis]
MITNRRNLTANMIKPGTRVIIPNPDSDTPAEITVTIEFGNATRFRGRDADDRAYWSSAKVARLANN